jgi:hypothetical protein
VTRALGALLPPLREYVASRMRSEYGEGWRSQALGALHTIPALCRTRPEHLDTDMTALFSIVGKFWHVAFRHTSGRFDRVLFDEAREFRNGLAHGDRFSLEDSFRALHTAHRLLKVIGCADRRDTDRLLTYCVRRWAAESSPVGVRAATERQAGGR